MGLPQPALSRQDWSLIRMRRDVVSFQVAWTVLLAGLMVLTGCAPRDNPVEISKGEIDLSSRDIAGRAPLTLVGEWAFAREAAVDPKSPPTIGPDPDFLGLPGLWRGTTARGTPLTATGQGVYRLRLRLPDAPLALLVTGPLAVCQVWAGEALLAATGVPGDSKGTERPARYAAIADLPPPGPQGRTEIFIRLSNHHNTIGGLGGNLILGDRKLIERMLDRRRAAGTFMAGALAALFLYHGMLFVSRRKDKSNLYFSLFCLLWGLATLFSPATGYVMDIIFPSISWGWYVNLAILPYGMTIPLLLLFYHDLFPKPYARAVNAAFLCLGAAYMLAVLLFGPCGYGSVPFFYYLATRPALLYLLGNAALDVARRKKDVWCLLPGYLGLAYAEFDDFLFDAGIIGSADFGPYGVFLFVLSASLFLSARMSQAYRLAEENLALKTEIDLRRATEQRLHLMQRRLSGMLDSLDAPLAAVNRSREICFCNQAFAALLGRSVHSLPGRPLRDILSDPDGPGAVPLLDAAGLESSAPGRTWTFEGIRLRGGKGRINGVALDATHLELEDEPLLLLVVRGLENADAGRAVLASIAMLRELETNRNRLSRLEEVLQAESASVPIGGTDVRGDITALMALLDRIGTHLSEGGGDAQRRREAVRVMNLALDCWSACTGTTKADLAQQSRIWNVYMEKDGYCRTQTLDKYLNEKTLPSRPRWRDILSTAEFVLANCEAGRPACAELALALARFRSLA